MPTKEQGRSFFRLISKNERIFFFTFLFFFFLSLAGILRISYLQNTKLAPAEGGTLREIIIGRPQSLNPLLAYLYEADKDIVELLFSGLLEYDGQGNLEKDLAKEYEISEDGRTYLFTLKDKIFWSDGKEITTDDVVFTVETMLSPKVQTPLALSFEKVKVEKIDAKKVQFTIPQPYFPFLENFTFKILPRHIFEGQPIENIISPLFNKEMAWSGPFKVEEIRKEGENVIEIILVKNKNYHQKKPWLEKINLKFVNDQDEAFKEQKWANAIALGELPLGEMGTEKRFKTYSLALPRYFALFLNQNHPTLKEKAVKEALALATPKEEIIKKVLKGEARKIDGVFLPENKINGDFQKYSFDLEAAKTILENEGWKNVSGAGPREKKIEEKAQKLEFNFFAPKQPLLEATAKILKAEWAKIGVKTNLQILDPQILLQEHLKERSYDILLLGYALNIIPDPFIFWHSTQVQFPGRNLSLYQNSEVDKLLKNSREEINLEKRKEMLGEIQKRIAEDIPAIFLFSPNYLYILDKEIKGVEVKFIAEPSKRFVDITNWYIKEKRVKKTR